MNLKPGGKLKMGPLWDFDLSLGDYPWPGGKQDAVNNPEGLYIAYVAWYARLLQDPVFVAKVKERFSEYYSNKQNMLDFIDAKAAVLINKTIEDNKVWGTITATNATDDEAIIAYQEKVDALKTWLTTRLDWLNTYITEHW